MERLGAAQLPRQRARARARDDAVRAARRRARAADLRLAGQHGPAQPAAADLVPRRLLEAAGGRDRALPHARLGRVGRQAAQRGQARRGAVPVRLRPRDGRPREDHPEAARDRRLGPVRGGDRDHRPHLAHDVAPDRPEAPDVRPGARREVRRLDREGLQARRRLRRPAAPEGAEGRRVHGHVRPRLPLVPPRGEPQHLAGPERLHVGRGPEPGEEPAGPVRPRQVLRGRRLVEDPRLRGGPRADLLQPQGARGEGHRLGRRGVPAAAGRDPREAAAAHGPRDRRARLRRRLQARRHLQGRVHPDGARPAGRLPGRLPRGLAGHARHDPPRRRREQQQEVVGRPLRHRDRDLARRLLLQPQDRDRRSRTSWTSPPRS